MITYRTFLMHKDTASWKKLIDIKDFPDLGGAPEMVETTTLSDRMKTYEPGIQDTSALEFTCAYSVENYKALLDLKDKLEEYAVWFGGDDQEDGTCTPTGADGKFSWKGKLDVYKTGGSSNEHQELKVTITPSTVISFSDGTE